KCGKNTAILQVALNTVTRHAITNDAAALKRHLADQLGFFDRHTVFYGIDVAAVTVDDLPAITPWGAKAHLHGFQNGDLKTVLQQKKRSGESGIAGTNNTDIGFGYTLPHWEQRRTVGGCGVIGVRISCVRHFKVRV